MLTCLLLWGTLAGAQAKAAEPAGQRPNIIIIYADDLGYGDLGCYGGTRIRTPNLDGLARSGVRFTEFYSAASVCTPSRAALLTGRYPIRSGLTRVLFPGSRTGIDDPEFTLAEGLKKRGYATACVGKWHLGHMAPFLPTRHGFDSYLGIPYSNDMRPTPLVRDDQVIETPAVQETLTRRYTQAAVRFIRRHAAGPFFLYLAHTMPHVPLAASKDFKGRSPGGLYGDTVEELDWSVGEIIKTLREVKQDRNTLVMFSSDNGPWLIKREHAGSAGPLREGKATLYEGGVRVPFIACWPGRIPPGRTCNDPAIMLDVMPTCLHLAGGALPVDRPSDGRDISKLMTGAESRVPVDREFFFYWHEDLHAVRSGKWKLHPRYRLPNGKEHEPELFDLKRDPGEKNNLAYQYPQQVERLTRRMEEFDREAKRNAAPAKR